MRRGRGLLAPVGTDKTNVCDPKSACVMGSGEGSQPG